jgi:hypothetical protein
VVLLVVEMVVLVVQEEDQLMTVETLVLEQVKQVHQVKAIEVDMEQLVEVMHPVLEVVVLVE